MALIQFRTATGSPLRALERGVDPCPDRFPTPLLEPEDLWTPNWRDRSCTGSSSQKCPQNDLTLARHRPSLAKSQRACRQSLAWGKRGRAKLARIYRQAHSTATFFVKIIGHVPVLLGHGSIKPILCSKEIGSEIFFLRDKSAHDHLPFHPRIHASWLNQIEIWFSILVRKLLRRANFRSRANLKASIETCHHLLQRRQWQSPSRWTMTALESGGSRR